MVPFEISYEDFRHLIASRSIALLRVSSFLEVHGHSHRILTRPLVGELLFQSTQLEELLDSYGARNNSRWERFRSLTAAIKLFSYVSYELLHIQHSIPAYRLLDIGEDFAMKRVYLPIKVMKMFRYSMDDLSKSTINRNFKNLWEYEAKIAKNYYDRFLSAVEYLDEKSIKPVLASALLYQKILDKVRENGYDCFGSRNYVTQDEKKIIISSISLREERRV